MERSLRSALAGALLGISALGSAAFVLGWLRVAQFAAKIGK